MAEDDPELTIELTDLRFMLPRPPRTVALLGDTAGSAEAFALVGLDVVSGTADLALGSGAVALHGRGGARALEAAGLDARRFLALPDVQRPAHVLPLDRRAPLRYAVRHFAGRASRVKALRNRLAPTVLARGVVPPGRALAVAARPAGTPYLFAAAREAGVPVEGDYFWSTGSSDLLSRGALFVFAPGAASPQWVIKFGRVPGSLPAFDRDARGLAAAAQAGGVAAAHAPRLLARFEAGGSPAAVETAAHGERLQALLESSASDTEKRAAIDRIAGWIVEVGRQTAASSSAIGPELDRLRSDVLPAWRELDAGEELLAGLEGAPAVLQHNDLGTWNLLVTAEGFTAVDWESARPAGLPLWDLVYFLSYAIVGLDGVATADHEAHLVDVYLGKARSSELLFRWVRQAVASLGLDAGAVGRLATTSWLHHGLSYVARSGAVRAAGGAPATEATALPRALARRWLQEPGLGAGWSRWRA